MTSSVAEEPAKKRILIIEDEPDIVRGLSDALTFEGFEVQARGNPAGRLLGVGGRELAGGSDRLDVHGADDLRPVLERAGVVEGEGLAFPGEVELPREARGHALLYNRAHARGPSGS